MSSSPPVLRLKKLRIALPIVAGFMAGSLIGLSATRSEIVAPGPCDVLVAGNTPCVAAHSTVRSLYAKYTGALYQMKRASDSATQNIGLLSDGYANAETQEPFCKNHLHHHQNLRSIAQ